MADLIDRQAAIEKIHWLGLDHDTGIKCDLAIRALPSVKSQEQKTGHWITKDGKEQGYDIGGVKTWYIQMMCDKCGFIKTVIEGHTGQYHYCPSCGCRMIEPQESEEQA